MSLYRVKRGTIRRRRKQVGTDPIPPLPIPFSLFSSTLYRVKKKNWNPSDSSSSNNSLLPLFLLFLYRVKKKNWNPSDSSSSNVFLLSSLSLSSQKEKLEPFSSNNFLLLLFLLFLYRVKKKNWNRSDSSSSLLLSSLYRVKRERTDRIVKLSSSFNISFSLLSSLYAFTESKRKIGTDPIPPLPFSFLSFLYRVKREKTNPIPNLSCSSNISLLPPFSFYGFIESKRKIGTDPIPPLPMPFPFFFFQSLSSQKEKLKSIRFLLF